MYRSRIYCRRISGPANAKKLKISKETCQSICSGKYAAPTQTKSAAALAVSL